MCQALFLDAPVVKRTGQQDPCRTVGAQFLNVGRGADATCRENLSVGGGVYDLRQSHIIRPIFAADARKGHDDNLLWPAFMGFQELTRSQEMVGAEVKR